jgi:hypothetical protein
MYQDHHRASTGMRQWAVALVAEGGKVQEKSRKIQIGIFLFIFFIFYFLFF